MTDKELLTLAAKAAGFHDATWAAKQACIETSKFPGFRCFWNPLTDDDDALRLAVRLHIDLRINNGVATAIWIDEELSETYSIDVLCDESFEGWAAKEAATRRAIVRAAAEIGKNMGDQS